MDIYNIKMETPLNIMYTCKCCEKTSNKMNIKKGVQYENRQLGEGGFFRCSKCATIKPINNFELVHKNKSLRRRKACDECRKAQMRTRYHKQKALQSNDNN